ncbi:hypothetical protein Tco_0742686 [Tanacetum coccineum]
MSFITAQQAKLDLELVPKEKRLDIRKCNGRLNPGKIQREPTFQVVLDALALTPCYSAFLITADVPEVCMHPFWDSVYKHDTFYRFKIDKRKRFKLSGNLGHTGEIHSLNDVVVDQMHQPWRTFSSLINRSLSGKTTGLDKLRLSRAQILWGMYHQNNVDYVELLWEDFIYQIYNKAYKKQDKLFVSAREETQIYGDILPESLTTPEMKETKAYQIYLSFATGATPPKKARKFKKPASPKHTIAPSKGIVIRETPEIPVSKKKEKVDVARGKGIELLSDVALTEEVRKKSLRDFHKTHPSGSGTVTKPTSSTTIIKLSVTNEGTEVKPGVPNATEEESSESKAKSWGNDDDDGSKNDQDSGSEESDQDKDNDDDKSQSDNEDKSDSKHETDDNESGSESDQEKDDEEEEEKEIVKTPSNDSDDEDETKIADKAKVDADKGFGQEECTDATMTKVQQGNENPEISQVIEDAHVTLSTILHMTEVLVSSSSHSSDLATKFLNFLDIPTTEAEFVSPLDVPVHHEIPSQQTPTLPIVAVSVISESSPVISTVIPQSLQSFTPPPLLSTPTPPPTTEATNPPSTLLDFVSVFQFNNRVTAQDPLHT